GVATLRTPVPGAPHPNEGAGLRRRAALRVPGQRRQERDRGGREVVWIAGAVGEVAAPHAQEDVERAGVLVHRLEPDRGGEGGALELWPLDPVGAGARAEGGQPALQPQARDRPVAQPGADLPLPDHHVRPVAGLVGLAGQVGELDRERELRGQHAAQVNAEAGALHLQVLVAVGAVALRPEAEAGAEEEAVAPHLGGGADGRLAARRLLGAGGPRQRRQKREGERRRGEAWHQYQLKPTAIIAVLTCSSMPS